LSNRTSGNRFEQEFAEFLSKHGFWVHVMQQNKSGQPADIIAVKGDYHCLIDCKEVSTRAGFVLDRVEENQRMAMTMFQNRGGQIGWFAVKYPDGVVRMISLIAVMMAEKLGAKAISGMLAEQFMTAEEWAEITDKKAGKRQDANNCQQQDLYQGTVKRRDGMGEGQPDVSESGV